MNDDGNGHFDWARYKVVKRTNSCKLSERGVYIDINPEYKYQTTMYA